MFQVHIVGHFCDRHEPVIHIYKMNGNGPLAVAKLLATYPEGDEALVFNDVQRYEHDVFGKDMPTRIIPDIVGLDRLREVMDREVMNHTAEADKWVAELLLGNVQATVFDGVGGLDGSYL